MPPPELPPTQQVEVWLSRFPPAERLERLARAEQWLRSMPPEQAKPVDREVLEALAAWRLNFQLRTDLAGLRRSSTG